MSTITYTVTIASAKFLIDGAVAPKLTFRDGDTYVFDQADSTNSGHILQFSITSNNSGGAEYTTGVTKTGTPGSGGAKTTIITSTSTTDTLYYYSSGGGTHGEEFSNTGFNTSTTYNLLKPIVGAESTAEKWGPMINHSIDQISEKFTAIDAIPAYDDNVVQTNIALLAFKIAVNGSLAKYNLQDQIIDEYVVDHDHTNTGIDDGPSTNHIWTAGVYSSSTSVNTPPVHSGSDTLTYSTYTIQKFDNTGSTETLTIAAAGNVDILVVAGGASGATSYGGGGGAGGLVYKGTHGLTANTYNAVIGDGGAGHSGSAAAGNDGADSTWSINGGSTEFTAKGGGGGANADFDNARDGGSGGGSGYSSSTDVGEAIQGDQAGESGSLGFGFDGGQGGGGVPYYSPGGGGGAGGTGFAGNSGRRDGGNGGIGKDYGSIFGTAVGDGGWFASGGGGEAPHDSGGADRDNATAGGGSHGSYSTGSPPWSSLAPAAQDGTGGGGGGGQNDPGVGSGGSGVILVRYPTAQTWLVDAYADLTLQSLDTTAEAVPTKADMVMLMEDSTGTATINTDIKGYVSRDSGSTFTEGTLVDEGDWGTDKRILAFHDLSFTSSTGQAMCYKITTHNQDASLDTRIHATSIGWR